MLLIRGLSRGEANLLLRGMFDVRHGDLQDDGEGIGNQVEGSADREEKEGICRNLEAGSCPEDSINDSTVPENCGP